MLILGIETSCDETAAAVLDCESLKIISNVVHSQVELHKKWGGVYPALAKREHQLNLPVVLAQVLKKAKIPLKNPGLAAIAVTTGPGLEPCLWQGINFAKELAGKWRLPLIGVNHIEAHIAANFIGGKLKTKIPKLKILPAICLIVSGGHTQLILMKGFGQYKTLGETRDDAAGECLDKCARVLGLSYPGGPAIAKVADAKYKTLGAGYRINLPRPMINGKDYDFSFSGLKTAVLYDYQKRPAKVKKSKEYIIMMARELQQAIIDVLTIKTLRAAEAFKAKSIILGGGVASNSELRKRFKFAILDSQFSIDFLAPPKNLCTDNAAMIAATGCFYYNKFKAKPSKELTAQGNLSIR